MTQALSLNSIHVVVSDVALEPWKTISEKGMIPIWLESESQNLVLLRGITPNIFTNCLNRIIENLRWHRGRIKSYLLAYGLMVILFPFRLWVPKLQILESVVFCEDRIKLGRIKVPELLVTLRWKKLAAMRHFLKESQADYLLLINPSTYVNFGTLLSFIRENAHGKYFYSGKLARSADSEFVVGSFILLNRLTVKILYEKAYKIPVHTLDDVAFGKVLRDFGITPTPCPTIEIKHLNELPNLTSQIQKVVNFKIKTSGPDRSASDISVMYKLHKLLKG